MIPDSATYTFGISVLRMGTIAKNIHTHSYVTSSATSIPIFNMKVIFSTDESTVSVHGLPCTAPVSLLTAPDYAPTFDSFPVFAKLPIELRNKIWPFSRPGECLIEIE